jgi:hypothetical protein
MFLFFDNVKMTLREERENRGIINQFSSEKVFDLLGQG